MPKVKPKNSPSVCIIGDGKTKSNVMLINEASKKFSVFFAPINGIRLRLEKGGASVMHRNLDLRKFNVILPRIPNSYSGYAHQLLSLIPSNVYLPVKSFSFLACSGRFFMFNLLRKNNIPTIDLSLARSNKASKNVFGEFEFPLIIRIPGKNTGIIAKSETEAKTIIDAIGSLGKSILIEKLDNSELVSIFIIGGKAFPFKKISPEKDMVFSKCEYKKISIKKDEEMTAFQAVKTVKSQIARVDMFMNPSRIANIVLNPSLSNIPNSDGTNVIESLTETLYDNYSKGEWG